MLDLSQLTCVYLPPYFVFSETILFGVTHVWSMVSNFGYPRLHNYFS
jgi:hypothetical protein